MTSREIENWTLRVVDAVLSGRGNEDSFVEFKREFAQDQQDYNRLARRLAGLANAARGEPVLLVVGVDEKARAITSAGEVEISNWWSGVKRNFDELPPTFLHLNVPIQGSSVQAFAFETDRAPFVVKSGTGGAITGSV